MRACPALDFYSSAVFPKRKTLLASVKMAFAVQNPPSVSPPDPPSVHPQETSTHNPLSSSYRSRLLQPVLEEYESTKAAYEALDRVDHKFRVFNLEGCRTDCSFAVSKADRTVHVLTNACRLRWCPLCSKSRSRFISEAVTAWLEKHPRPKLLTLTLVHSADSIDCQATRIYACFREFRRRKFFRDRVRGGIWFFQIKKSANTDEWHPHLHVLLDSEYIPHGLLKASWKQITGDSEIVDIRVIHKASMAASYVARYSARPANLSELSLSDRLDLIDALHGRRLCGKWGTASEVDLSGKSGHNADNYRVVVGWHTARTEFYSSARIRILYKHYETGNPLPIEFDIDALAREYNTNPFTLGDLPPPKTPEPCLFAQE